MRKACAKRWRGPCSRVAATMISIRLDTGSCGRFRGHAATLSPCTSLVKRIVTKIIIMINHPLLMRGLVRRFRLMALRLRTKILYRRNPQKP